jgi:C_GCAxxG_C_C family probable redox protein
MNRCEFVKLGTGGLVALVAAARAAKSEDVPAGPAKAVDAEKLVGNAHKHFIPGKLTCSEALVLAGTEASGVKGDMLAEAALGLCGGVGFQGRVCGAITGAAMVISLAVAAKEKDYKKRKLQTATSVGRLCQAFEKEAGSADCRKITGLDLTTPEGRKALEERVKEEKCSGCVKLAARLLAEELKKT